MMHVAGPRLAPDAPTSSNAAPVAAAATRHHAAAVVAAAAGYGGATESIYPAPTAAAVAAAAAAAGVDPSAHSAHYHPPYNQRGLVKSNSVDIYRLSESPNHAHANTTNLPVTNAFPSYGR